MHDNDWTEWARGTLKWSVQRTRSGSATDQTLQAPIACGCHGTPTPHQSTTHAELHHTRSTPNIAPHNAMPTYLILLSTTEGYHDGKVYYYKDEGQEYMYVMSGGVTTPHTSAPTPNHHVVASRYFSSLQQDWLVSKLLGEVREWQLREKHREQERTKREEKPVFTLPFFAFRLQPKVFPAYVKVHSKDNANHPSASSQDWYTQDPSDSANWVAQAAGTCTTTPER